MPFALNLFAICRHKPKPVASKNAIENHADQISVDVENRSLTRDAGESELNRRQSGWVRPAPRYQRGYGHVFLQHIGQADTGCDFAFLKADFGINACEPVIH